MTSLAQTCPRCGPLPDSWTVHSPRYLCADCRREYLATLNLIDVAARGAPAALPAPCEAVYVRGRGVMLDESVAAYSWEGVGLISDTEDRWGQWPYVMRWHDAAPSPLPHGWRYILLWEARLCLPGSPLAIAGRCWPGLARPHLALIGLERPHARAEYRRLGGALGAFGRLPFVVPPPQKPKGSGRFPDAAAFKAAIVPRLQDRRLRGLPVSAEALARDLNTTARHLRRLAREYAGAPWNQFVAAIPPPPRRSRN
jgi:hypothetical protein